VSFILTLGQSGVATLALVPMVAMKNLPTTTSRSLFVCPLYGKEEVLRSALFNLANLL